MVSVKICLVIALIALSMLLTSRSYACFTIKAPAAAQKPIHTKHTLKTTRSYWQERPASRHQYSPTGTWGVILGIISILAGIAAPCMFFAGISFFFAIGPVPSLTVAALLLVGGVCAGIIAIVIGNASHNDGGIVGNVFVAWSALIAISPFLLVYGLGLLLYTIIFPRPAKKRREKRKNRRYKPTTIIGKAFAYLLDAAFQLPNNH